MKKPSQILSNSLAEFYQSIQPKSNPAMPRTFTIPFNHQYQLYTAIITQLGESISVYIPDQRLHHIIPNGRFSYDAKKGITMSMNDLIPQENLLLELLKAMDLQNRTHVGRMNGMEQSLDFPGG